MRAACVERTRRQVMTSSERTTFRGRTSFMATLLIGYDTEAAAVGEGLARFLGPGVPQYRAALDPDTTRRGVALLARLHEELDAPCTFFVCGRTLLHALDAIVPLAGSPLFDIQQHTY